MKKPRVYFDSTEIMMIYEKRDNPLKKKIAKISLTYDNIQSISIEECKETRLFKIVDSERILIRTSKLSNPIVYFKLTEKEYFDEYKSGFRKFAKSNRVTLYDTVKS